MVGTLSYFVRDVKNKLTPNVAGPLNFTFPAFASVLVAVGGSGSKLCNLRFCFFSVLIPETVSFGLGVARGLLEDIRNGRSRCTYLAMVWTVREKG